MILATIDSDAYKIVLVLHILCAIVGFGAVVLNGVYGAQAKAHKGPEGLAIAEANYFVSKIAEYVIYAVFVLGIVLVLLSDDAWKFSQTWVWLAMTLFIIALGISHGFLTPRVRKMISLMREMGQGPPPAGGPPPQAAQLEQLGQQVGAAGATLNVMLVAILTLMVFKPGV